MIEKLEEQPICDYYGNCYGSRAPSEFEMMEKINELIDEINTIKEKLNLL